MTQSDKNFSRSALVMIDVVKGMTSEGSFGVKYGKDELRYIDNTVSNIENFIHKQEKNFFSKCLIRSIYPVGKFTNDKQDALYNLCVRDSDDIENLFPLYDNWFEVNKDENDAMKDENFNNWLSNLNDKHVDNLYIIGFTLTSCIKETALSVANFFKKNDINIRIILPLNLISYRAKYSECINNEKSIKDKVVDELKKQGIVILNNIDI